MNTNDKLNLSTPDLVSQNIEKIANLFPNCVTETAEGKAIDFDLLKQELNHEIVEGAKERYRLEWPGKKEAIVTANLPTTKTLRPVPEDSMRKDGTPYEKGESFYSSPLGKSDGASENIYIEGDNLEVLKILQESYLGKIKMIYIDPPYNTGKDFVYKDNFTQDSTEFKEESGQIDEYGNRLVANPETAGRYHSDWLSMMYPRLKLARNLLTDDGVIFISIDDNEFHNLKRIADEIFGEINFRNNISVRRRSKSLNLQFAENGLNSLNVGFEYILVYSKSSNFLMNPIEKKKEKIISKGKWNVFWSNADRPTMRYNVLGFTPETGQWRWSKEKAEEGIKNYNDYLNVSDKYSLEEYWKLKGENKKFVRRIEDGVGKNGGVQYWVGPKNSSLRTTNWTDIEVSEIHKEFELFFSNPKSKTLVKELIKLSSFKSISNEDLILDMFSGSATTAHAVLQLNAEDGGNRKFIMAQLPEATDEKSEAYNAGYKNICELGKERIRRAAAKIKEELALSGVEGTKADIDYGFKVFKVDSSNMQDVYYKPQDYNQGQLDVFADNIKPDRTAEDLLTQILLDWGLPLTLKTEVLTIQDKEVFKIAENSLMACFSEGVDEAFAKELAKHQPLRVVFKDSGFKNDTAKENVKQLLKQLSPNTEMKVI